GLDRLDVRGRVDAARDVDDVRVLEAAHDVRDGRDLADVRQELVAQPLALVGALHEPGDVDELDARRHHRRLPVGLRVQAPQRLEALVRHGHDADVPVDRGEGVVGGLYARLGDRVEEGGLAHVGQPYDADA